MPSSRYAQAALALVLAAGAASAQEATVAVTTTASSQTEAEGAAAAEPSLDSLLWVARPLVVFADTPDDPRYAQQLQMLENGVAELDERRVVVLTDADPAANGPLRQALRPRGFGLVLIDTDGSVVQRRPSPTTVRELSGTIDRLPSRREESGSRRP